MLDIDLLEPAYALVQIVLDHGVTSPETVELAPLARLAYSPPGALESRYFAVVEMRTM